jgi:AmmeMemoRadiSam system protein A
MTSARDDSPTDLDEALSAAVLALARRAVETYVRDRTVVADATLPPGLPERAGVFVTLRVAGDLRGCIGSIEPIEPTLTAELVRSAVLSATEDPRFAPVEAHELEQLDYSVSVLEPPEPIPGPDQLDPARYGVVVRSGLRRGLLLPNLEGVTTVAQQVDIARRKAGIPAGAPLRLFRFRTRHFPPEGAR